MPCCLYIDRDVTGLFYSLDIYTRFKYGCVCVRVVCVLGCIQLFVIPWTVVCQGLLSMEYSNQKFWSRLPFLPPGNLLTQGSNLCLLHWQTDSLPPQIFYHRGRKPFQGIEMARFRHKAFPHPTLEHRAHLLEPEGPLKG